MMKRVRIKICGLRTGSAAQAAAAAGADAIGLVFYRPSSRSVTLEQALNISAQVPPFVTRVALFLDAQAEEVAAVCERLRPDLLQFHGRETPDFCRQFGVPYIKAVPMADMDENAADLSQWAQSYHDARGLLLDGHSAGKAGGQGRGFVWNGQAAALRLPIIVAGGLSAANVGTVIDQWAPYAVDVSSGVESAPGVKDPQLMNEFFEAVAGHVRACCATGQSSISSDNIVKT